jgi:hypothetical protein
VLDEDGKRKARPAGVLIVVVGVEVKGASRKVACWRFSRYAREINVPSASTCSDAYLNRLPRSF